MRLLLMVCTTGALDVVVVLFVWWHVVVRLFCVVVWLLSYI